MFNLPSLTVSMIEMSLCVLDEACQCWVPRPWWAFYMG